MFYLGTFDIDYPEVLRKHNLEHQAYLIFINLKWILDKKKLHPIQMAAELHVKFITKIIPLYPEVVQHNNYVIDIIFYAQFNLVLSSKSIRNFNFWIKLLGAYRYWYST